MSLTPRQGVLLRDVFVGLIEQEAAGTRRVIRAFPEEQRDWRPHPTGTPALELAWHIVQAEILLAGAIARGSTTGLRGADPPPTFEAVAAHHERELEGALALLRGLSPEALVEEVPMLRWHAPRARHLSFLLLHSVHHRGQLSAYLRAMGAFVPGVYGPSADERAKR
jgi:uncharacterized damage-inducible protein DinB